MKILLTGFEPFGGDSINASWEAVKLLPDTVGSAQLIHMKLPVVYGKAGQIVVQKAADLDADIILCTGVAGGRTHVTPELVAVNWRMASIADHDGVMYTGEMLRKDAPAALMTDLPIMQLVQAGKDTGVPCMLSLSAGAYVCNDVYWHILEYAAKAGRHALFVHVPALPQLPAADAANALEAMIRTLAAQ